MKTTWTNKTRRNPTAKLPYAYVPTEYDPLALETDWDCIKWVKQGFDYLEDSHSTRKVAAWITEKSGHKISHQGIMNLWNIHCRPETDMPYKLLQERAKELKKAALKGRTAKKVAAAKRKKAKFNRCLRKSLMNMKWAYMKPRVIEILVMALQALVDKSKDQFRVKKLVLL